MSKRNNSTSNEIVIFQPYRRQYNPHIATTFSAFVGLYEKKKSWPVCFSVCLTSLIILSPFLSFFFTTLSLSFSLPPLKAKWIDFVFYLFLPGAKFVLDLLKRPCQRGWAWVSPEVVVLGGGDRVQVLVTEVLQTSPQGALDVRLWPKPVLVVTEDPRLVYDLADTPGRAGGKSWGYK